MSRNRKRKDLDRWMQENKVVNLRLAVARLTGVVLLPCENLSYWRCIGNPTRQKGYVDLMIRDNPILPGKAADTLDL